MEINFQPMQHRTDSSHSQGLTNLSSSYLHDENNVVLTSSSSLLNNNINNITSTITNMYYDDGTSSSSNNNNSLEPPPAKSRKICSNGDDDEDGSLCLICFAPYESSGEHRVACLRCGHVFGFSCIRTWLAKGTLENPATCPTCSSIANQHDIRILYTKAITAIDTTDRDRALRELELAQNSKYQAELEIEMLKIVTQTKDEEIRRLKTQIIQQQSVGQQQQQFPKTTMNPVVFQTNPNSMPVGNFATSSTARRQAIIWSGSLEWHEKIKGTNEHQNVQNRTIPCQVSTNIINGVPELKSDGWPAKLILQLIPKLVVAKLGRAYFREVKTALFNFQPCDSLNSLTRMMESGFAACIHISGMSDKNCPTKIMILMYNKERHSFLGFIPNDQAGFVEQIRNVIQQQKTQQAVMRLAGPSTSNPISSSSGSSSSSSTSSSSNPNTVGNQFVESLPTRPTVLQQPQSLQQSMQYQQSQHLLTQRLNQHYDRRNLIKMQAMQKTIQNTAQAQANELHHHHHHHQQQQQQQQQNLWPSSYTMPSTSNISGSNSSSATTFTSQQPSRNFSPYNLLPHPLHREQTLTHPNQMQAPEIVLLD